MFKALKIAQIVALVFFSFSTNGKKYFYFLKQGCKCDLLDTDFV
jgi:hypothetical protein